MLVCQKGEGIVRRTVEFVQEEKVVIMLEGRRQCMKAVRD